MSRGGSSGGGQSSLGYLFGPEGGPQPPKQPPPSPSTTFNPPYGIDKEDDNDEKKQTDTSEKQDANINNYHRSQGQNSGNFITDRPSTKVKYVPGGNSSLGYLFGDNK